MSKYERPKKSSGSKLPHKKPPAVKEALPKKTLDPKKKRHIERHIEPQDTPLDANVQDIEAVEEEVQTNIDQKTIARLKRKINSWMDYDDKIKILNAKAKKYKDAKNQQEESILKALTNCEKKAGDLKIDVTGDDNKIRGCVYRYESQNKEPLKEGIIKDALMEHFGNEKKVKELLKKIDKKRPMKKRYYLKRTKGINTK